MALSFRQKLFFTFVLYGLVLVLLTQIIILKINTDAIKSTSIDEASIAFNQKDNRFKSYIEDINLKIISIMDSSTFREYLLNPLQSDTVSALFLDIANTSNNTMQLRYIDITGMEKIRIDRDSSSSKLYILDNNSLQDKSSRYYFNEILDTPKGEFWYSDIDLNIEHGEIEKPIIPVLRIGMPVYLNGTIDGVLIINIFMESFLHEIVDSSVNTIYIFDRDGDILVSSKNGEFWSKYLHNDSTISTQYLENRDILFNSKGSLDANFYSEKLSLSNTQDLHLLIEPKTDYIQKEIDKGFIQLVLIMIGVIFISFPFSYILSISPSKLKDELLSQKREQDILLSLFDLSDAVLIKWNYDTHFSIAYTSKSIYKLFGYTPKEFTSKKVKYNILIYKDDLKKLQREIFEAIANDDYYFTPSPYRIVTKDKTIKWVMNSTILVRDDNNKIVNLVGYISDITQLKNSEERFKILSRTDQLTDIYNRMHLDNILETQKYRFGRVNEVFSVILIDIDHFKSVNDSFGHLVGDSTLVEFSKLLQSSIRESDILGRWGGEEFLIILPHTDLPQAMQLAQKLQKTVEANSFTTIGSKTASFGVATFKKDMSIENLLEYADKALYTSKDEGRNRVTTTQLLHS